MKSKRSRKAGLRRIYIAAFFFTVHIGSTSFINSSFLSEARNIPTNRVGLLYTIGAIFTILLLTALPHILHRTSPKRVITLLLTLDVILLGGIILTPNTLLTIGLFIIYLATNMGIYFMNDIFIEHGTIEGSTGRIRSTLLTFMNLAWILTPMSAGFILKTTDGYLGIYSLALVFTLFMLGLVLFTYKDFSYKRVPTHPLPIVIKNFFHNLDLRRIFVGNFILQLFYALMVVYTPIYLSTIIGLEWGKIGLCFTIMLLAFPLTQPLLGYLADKKYGEKEILIIGLTVLSLTTCIFLGYQGTEWWSWAIILFTTRLGAAAVEIMTESYFFKHVNGSNAESISIFRSAIPLGYIVGPLLASLIFTIIPGTPYRLIFIILIIIILLGIIPSLRIHDTR